MKLVPSISLGDVTLESKTSSASIRFSNIEPVPTAPMITAFKGDKGDNGLGDIFAEAPAGVDYVAAIDADYSI